MDDTTRHPAGGAVLDRLEERNYWTDAAAEPGTTGTIRVMLRPLNGQSQQKGWDDPAEIARPAALPELRAPGAGTDGH